MTNGARRATRTGGPAAPQVRSPISAMLTARGGSSGHHEPYPLPPRPVISRPRDDLSTWKLCQFLDEAESWGLSVDTLVEATWKTPGAERRIEGCLPFDLVHDLFAALAAQVPENFAVELGRKWHLREFRLFGYALLTCRTFGEFTDRWIGHFDYLGIPLRFRSTVRDNAWRIEMAPHHPLSESVLRICVEEACASVFPIFEQATGKGLKAERVELTFGVAAYHDKLSRLLGVPVIAARRNALVINPLYRAQKLAIDRNLLLDCCRRNCGSIARSLQGDPLLERLREILLMACGRPPSLEAAARELGVSKRTLNRALAAQGWSYTATCHCYRRDMALELLRMGDVTAKEISFVLGYGSAESFRRAFRKWTGASVGTWMRKEPGLLSARSHSQAR